MPSMGGRRMGAAMCLTSRPMRLMTPAHPTKAVPGSAQKIQVTRLRIERGESCFHPDDANMDQAMAIMGRNGSIRIVGLQPDEEDD